MSGPERQIRRKYWSKSASHHQKHFYFSATVATESCVRLSINLTNPRYVSAYNLLLVAMRKCPLLDSR